MLTAVVEVECSTGVCLFIGTISQKPMQLGSPVSKKPTFLVKSFEAQETVLAWFLHSSECWLLVVTKLL